MISLEDKKQLERIMGHSIEDILDNTKWHWWSIFDQLERNACLKTLKLYLIINN